MTSLLIRDAGPADADAVASIHVRSWQAAYRGLIDQAFLDALSIADRAERWRGIFADPHPLTLGTLVAERDGTILGWTSFGASRDAEPASLAEPHERPEAERPEPHARPEAERPEEALTPGGEIYGIYADPAAWSAGVGHALLTAAEQRLSEAGHTRAHLWVLDGNDRADTFYARHGWAADGATKIEERPDLTLAEHRRVKHLEA